MISKFKKWSFKRSMNSHPNIKRADFKGRNLCAKVLILAEHDTGHTEELIQKFTKKLINHDKKVDLFYISSQQVSMENTLTKKDIKWNNTIKEDVLNKHISESYDLLIYLGTTLKDHHKYIIATRDSKLKIGPLVNETFDLFDVTIDLGKHVSIEDLIPEISKQLNIISNN